MDRHTGPVVTLKEQDAYVKDRALKCEEANNKMKKTEEEGKDIKITCENCSAEFTHTVADQIRFASRQWENLPGNARNAKIMNQQDLVLTLQLEDVVAGIDASSRTTPKKF